MNPDQTAPLGAIAQADQGSVIKLVWREFEYMHMGERFQDYSWIQDFEADFPKYWIREIIIA